MMPTDFKCFHIKCSRQLFLCKQYLHKARQKRLLPHAGFFEKPNINYRLRRKCVHEIGKLHYTGPPS